MRALLPRTRKVYVAIVSAAMAWAVANCLYVYLVLDGDKTYRIESAVLAFVALALPAMVARGLRAELAARQPMGRERVVIAALVATWLLVALPLLSFPFLSDDYGFLNLYRTLGDTMRPLQFYRPGFAVAFAVLGGVGGGSPIPFHAASFLLHLASAALVYSLARRLFGAAAPALVAFAAFLLSPIQLEAVLWVSGLQDLLWTFFALAAVLCYVEERELSLSRLALVLVLVACGLASKETAVCFVLLLPAADLLLFRFKRGSLLTWAYVAFAIELAVYLTIRLQVVKVEDAFLVAPSRYFVKQFLVMPYEIFIHPWNRSAVHVGSLVLCVAALAALGLLFVDVRTGAPARLLAGAGIVLFSTLPVYGLFFVGPDLAGSRYLYFATAGFALLLSELLSAIAPSDGLWSACVLAVAVLSALSLEMNLRPWRAAGELVNALGDGLRQGRAAVDIIQGWQGRHAAGLELRDGVPREYQGVGIFVNGYPEFTELATRPARSSR
jgi:hypothetical protein